MKNNKYIYIVTMYRYGDRELHSYVLGGFTKKQKAITEGLKEQEYRGNKYEPEIVKMIINNVFNKEIINIHDKIGE